MKFEPRGPIKILQRKMYSSTTIPNQVPRRPRDSRYGQGQPSYCLTEYEGAWYEKESGVEYNPREKKWPQGNGYRKRYGTGKEKQTSKSYKSNGAKSQAYYTTQGPRRNDRYLPAKGPGNGQDGNREDEGRDDKKKFRNTKYDFEDKGEEESDTEDSYELEISPKQLNQVIPGGGVLKIKLSKKKPIKITAGAPDGEPDPVQTKLKTVYGPISEDGGQLPLGVSSNVLIETEQPREKRLPPVRASQSTLGIGERRGPHILRKRVSRPNANGNGDPGRNGSSHGHGNSPHSNSGSNRDGNSPINGNPQRKGYSQRAGGGSNGDGESNRNGGPPDRRKGPPRGNGNPDGGDGGSDPDDSSSSSDSTLPKRRGCRRSKYVYVLQGPPGPPGREGQPGQAGRDGRDGQALPLTRALEETLRVQRTNLDTTGLENSFSQFGRTMSEVLKVQQRTNQNLEEQFKRANETGVSDRGHARHGPSKISNEV